MSKDHLVQEFSVWENWIVLVWNLPKPEVLMLNNISGMA
jgi:hypothetical protein